MQAIYNLSQVSMEFKYFQIIDCGVHQTNASDNLFIQQQGLEASKVIHAYTFAELRTDHPNMILQQRPHVQNQSHQILVQRLLRIIRSKDHYSKIRTFLIKFFKTSRQLALYQSYTSDKKSIIFKLNATHRMSLCLDSIRRSLLAFFFSRVENKQITQLLSGGLQHNQSSPSHCQKPEGFCLKYYALQKSIVKVCIGSNKGNMLQFFNALKRLQRTQRAGQQICLISTRFWQKDFFKCLFLNTLTAYSHKTSYGPSFLNHQPDDKSFDLDLIQKRDNQASQDLNRLKNLLQFKTEEEILILKSQYEIEDADCKNQETMKLGRPFQLLSFQKKKQNLLILYENQRQQLNDLITKELAIKFNRQFSEESQIQSLIQSNAQCSFNDDDIYEELIEKKWQKDKQLQIFSKAFSHQFLSDYMKRYQKLKQKADFCREMCQLILMRLVKLINCRSKTNQNVLLLEALREVLSYCR